MVTTAVKGFSIFAIAALVTVSLMVFFAPQAEIAVAGFENCSNNIDDDSDMLTDCEDVIDCALASNCEEDCFNEIDDDGDAAVDCDDYWCAWQEPACW